MVAARVGKERLAEEKRCAQAFGGVEQRARAQFARRRRPEIESAGGPARPSSPDGQCSRDRFVGDRAAQRAALRATDRRARRNRARDSRRSPLARRGSSPCRRPVCAAAAARESFAARRANRRAGSARSSSRTSRCRRRSRAPARRAAFAGWRERTVRIVLDDRNAGAPRDRRQSLAPVGVHRCVGRIVQRRHRINEARTPGAQHRLDVIDAHSLVVDRHRNRAQSVDLKDLQRARIRRAIRR